MPAGRPSKYNEAYCNEVIECLAQGHSITAFAGQIGVARSTITEWMGQHPEFSAAVKKGQAKAVAFWERLAISTAKGESKGNPVVIIFGLKNRAADDWADRTVQEHTGKDGGPIVISDEQRIRALEAVLAKAKRAELK